MKMIATKSFTYAGKPRKPGDEFDVTGRDVRLLSAVGRAKPAPPPPPPKPVKRDTVAEEPAAQPDEAKPRKGRYRRRDMKAENGEE